MEDILSNENARTSHGPQTSIAGNSQGPILSGQFDTVQLQYFHQTPYLRGGAPFQAPPLPAHFVPRTEVAASLGARLLASEMVSAGVLVVSAIHGLGGIGKSTVAAAVAHAPDIQGRFSDGILWATLGQTPDLLSLLGGWIAALGDYDFRPSSVRTAAMHLRTLLHDKSALLVVDDVWEPRSCSGVLGGWD